MTGDAVLDVVVGGGVEKKRGSVSLFKGETGELLWRTELADEVYTSPELIDVNGDQIPDVLVGGRFNDLVALSGQDGTKLWAMRQVNPEESIPDTHFNTPRQGPDLDGDKIRDLVVVQSGGKDFLVRRATCTW
jgi:hypothetical protein